MKIKCKKDLIYKAFQLLNGFTSNTTTKPILQNVKIEVKDNIIDLYATDLEIGIRYFIELGKDDGEVENGIIVLPENNVESILREWGEEFIEIKAENSICNFSGKNSNFVINGEVDIEQFPSSPIFSEDGFIEVDFLVISQMIKRTVFVIISEKIRYTLCGVLFRVEGNSIEMIATDGKRLSKVSNIIDNPHGISCNCIIPAKSLIQLERAISCDTKSIHERERGLKHKLKVNVENNRILFKSSNFIFTSQLIDGKYPDYEKIIPKESNFDVILKTKDIITSIKRAAVITTEGSRLVKFTFNDNKLILAAEVSEIGSSRVVMDIDYNNDFFEIGFNPTYIIDVLNVVTSDTIKIKFTEQGKAGVIIEKLINNSSNDSYSSDDSYVFIHVVMPISLRVVETEEAEKDNKVEVYETKETYEMEE